MTKKISLWQRLKNTFIHAKSNASTNNQADNAKPSHSSKDSSEAVAMQDLTGQMVVDLTQKPTETLSQSFNPENSNHNFAENLRESETITADDLDVMLASMGYQFTYHPPKHYTGEPNATHANQENINIPNDNPIHHFTMQVSDGEQEWGCMMRFFESQQLLAVYSIFPFSVPDSHRGEMLAVISYLNYDLVLGNVEMDISDGELRFKTSLDLEVTGLNEFVLAYLLQSNFSVVSRLDGTLVAVVAKSTPAETMNEAVDSLLLDQQAKTFYLMTDTIS